MAWGKVRRLEPDILTGHLENFQSWLSELGGIGGGKHMVVHLHRLMVRCKKEQKERYWFCVCPVRIRTSNLFSSGQMSQGALPNFSHGTFCLLK